jgi:hypothetical protein
MQFQRTIATVVSSNVNRRLNAHALWRAFPGDDHDTAAADIQRRAVTGLN